MYDDRKKKVSRKPVEKNIKKSIRKKRPRVESKQEYAQSLQEQMRQKRPAEESRLVEKKRGGDESIYDLDSSAYKSNIVMEERESYGNFLKAQIEEKRQRENRERSSEISRNDMSSDFVEESREMKREKQQQYAADLQEQIRIRAASRRDFRVKETPIQQYQTEEAHHIDRLSPKSTDRSSKNEYANYLRQQIEEKKKRDHQRKIEKQKYEERMDLEAQRYYDTMQRRQLEGTNHSPAEQQTTTTTTTSDAIDVLVSGSTTIMPRRRAESSAVEENRRKQMGSTGFLFGTSRRRAESSQVEENRKRQMGSSGIFGGGGAKSNNSYDNNSNNNNSRDMCSKNVTSSPTNRHDGGGYGHRKLRAVEQEDELMREREKAMRMKQVLDAQIEEKRKRKEREKTLELEREQEEMRRIERDRREMENNTDRSRHTKKKIDSKVAVVVDYQQEENEKELSKKTFQFHSNDKDPRPRTIREVVSNERRSPIGSSRDDMSYPSDKNGEEHVLHLQRQMELQNQLISSLQEQLKMQSNVSERNAERLSNLLRESKSRKEYDEEMRRRQVRDRHDNHFRESSTFQPVTVSNSYESPAYRGAKDKYWDRVQNNAKSTYDELDHLAESYTETDYDFGEYGEDDAPLTVSGVPII